MNAYAPSIAVAQTCAVGGAVATNVAQHVRLAELAASMGARTLLYPELSLTGYELDLAADLAFDPDDARLDPLRATASAAGITLIVGAPVALDGRLHIGAFIIGAAGDLHIYTKRRLGAFGAGAAVDGTVPPGEATVFQPADHDPLVDLGGVAAAIAICADIGDPAHALHARGRGCRAYLASMFVIPSDFDGDDARLASYAREHAMLVALANHGAATGGLAAAGRSSIRSEAGDLIVRLPAAGAGVGLVVGTEGGWQGAAAMLDGGITT